MYTVVITGTLNNYQTDTITFTITIVANPCLDTLINNLPITSPLNYDLKLGTSILTSVTWIQTVVSCPTITYTLLNADTGLAADIIFTIPTIANGINIVTTTSDPLKTGTHNLKLVATVGGYTSAFELFSVIIGDSCTTSSISSSTLLD